MRLPLFGSRTALRIPRREEPVLFREKFLPNARDRKAAGNGLIDGFLREHLPGGSVHDRGRNIVRRNQRVKRRSTRLRAIRLVEASVIDGATAVADVNERGLRQRGEQFVRRMRRKDRRAVLRVRRRIATHGVAVAIHRIETRVAVPRFIEMDSIDALCETRFRVSRVIAHAVIRAVGQHRIHGALVPARFGQRIVGDAFRYRFGLQLLRRNRPDDAVAIACRHQEYRNAARVYQPLFDGLVAIAVAQRDFVVTDTGRHDCAIRRGGAIGYRVRTVRAENPGRKSLALADRAAVPEHRAERAAFDAHVGAKQVFAEEVEEARPTGDFRNATPP